MFINQLRTKIGVMFGSPETTTGGNALRFYSSIRLDIRRRATQKNGAEATGNRVRVKVVKNKLAPPYTEAQFEIRFGEGINKVLDVLEAAEKLGVVETSGSWYSFAGQRLGHGREQIEGKLRDEPDLLAKIESEVRERFNQPRGSQAEAQVEARCVRGEGAAEQAEAA